MDLSLLRQNLAFLGGMLAGHLMCQGLLWLDRRRGRAMATPVLITGSVRDIDEIRHIYGADNPGAN